MRPRGLLLVWFFLLARASHCATAPTWGSSSSLSWMSPRKQRTTRIVGYLFSLLFFIEMLWGGLYAMGPAA
jgi:TRAP-type C4-dicarboxylate transport system permease small subunit